MSGKYPAHSGLFVPISYPMNTTSTFVGAAVLAALTSVATAQNPSMMRGIGWRTDAFFTIGETVNGYTPTGIPDGMSAFPGDNGRVNLFVQSELNPGNGYAYTLANGTMLTGARIHRFEISRVDKRGIVHDVRMAYDTMYDREGNEVVLPDQANETGNGMDGLARFCSGTGIAGGTFGFVEDIHICGEETSKPFHPHGGSVWVLDIDGEALWAAPNLGRGTWENVTPFDTGDAQTVGLLMGDDRGGAALQMWIGTKNGVGDQSFLDRNGLKQGTVYFWKADNGDTTPQQFNTKGSVRTGTWEAIAVIDPSQAGQNGYDALGYKDSDTLLNEMQAQDSFQFSRPEDLDSNPANPQQLAFNSTGRGSLFPADNWGTIYIVDMDMTPGALAATITIAADSDFEAVPDAGIRSPDNLAWASNGKIYVNEDRSTSPGSLFGGTTGAEASIWELDPVTFDINRIGEMNRSVVLPVGSTDGGAGSIGNWESSGIIDVTDLFDTEPGEVLLLSNVQAHGIQDGPIGGNPNPRRRWPAAVHQQRRSGSLDPVGQQHADAAVPRHQRPAERRLRDAVRGDQRRQRAERLVLRHRRDLPRVPDRHRSAARSARRRRQPRVHRQRSGPAARLPDRRRHGRTEPVRPADPLEPGSHAPPVGSGPR